MPQGGIYHQVAALHASCIDRGFLSLLGIPFLSLMYQAIDESAEGVLLIEEESGRVLGYVSGCCGMGPIYRQMLRHPMRLFWALLPSLLKPSRLRRILEILRYGRSQPTREELPGAELLSIAVAPEARGTGIAEVLYRRLVAHFRQQGVAAFKITVGDVLLPAQRFYTRMGAVPAAHVEVHAGSASTIFVQDCRASATGAS